MTIVCPSPWGGRMEVFTMPIDLNKRQSIEEITNGRIKKLAPEERPERPSGRRRGRRKAESEERTGASA